MIEELTATRTEVARLRTRLNEALAENERLEYVLDKRLAAARAWLAQRGAGLPEVWRRELKQALGVDTAQEAP